MNEHFGNVAQRAELRSPCRSLRVIAPLDHHVGKVTLLLLMVVLLPDVALVIVTREGDAIALPRTIAPSLCIVAHAFRQVQPAKGPLGGCERNVLSGVIKVKPSAGMFVNAPKLG